MSQKNSYFSQIRKEITTFLPHKVNTVLEIGCGAGETLKWLKENNYATHTIGIEISKAAATQASLKRDEVIAANIEESINVLNKFEKSIDILLLLDVLEHLNDPWRILSHCQKLLSSEGIIIASIPNVRSIKVLTPLIFYGEWNYQGSGILDKTHLRFFTKKSCINLFKDTGYKVEKIVGNGPLTIKDAKTLEGKIIATFNTLTLNIFQEFIANQHIILAKPASE